MSTLQAYYLLAKPGIVYGNGLHVLAGCLLAYYIGAPIVPIMAVLLGTSLLIASACVVNNYTDRSIDERMARTRSRPSVTGRVPIFNGAVYAALLLIGGLAMLLPWTPLPVTYIGLVAYIFYTVVYAVAKRTTVHSTLIGSIPGALPAIAGYVAVDGGLSVAAWLLFLLIVAWQMPHFYAISLFRKHDYQLAKLPVLGVRSTIGTVRAHMLVFQVFYVLCVIVMMLVGMLGVAGGGILLLAAIYWLRHALQPTTVPVQWAKRSFAISLQVSLVFVAVSALNIVLP